MKAIVTGGAGFIGSHLVDTLISLGHDVYVVDNLTTGQRRFVNPAATLHVLDVRSPDLKDWIMREKPDVVFHQAAQVDVLQSIRDPMHDTSVNVLGTVNLLQACCEASVGKFIYASSCAVYGDLQEELTKEDSVTSPISYYGISKLTPESYIRVFHQLYGLPYTILRYANVYGPRQTAKGEGGVVAIFLNRLKDTLPLLIHGDGEQTRDFVYVKDVVKANIAAIHRGDNETVQVGTATRTSVNTLVATMEGIHGSAIPTGYGPKRPGDIQHSCLDNSKARAVLGWVPAYDVKQGIRETYSVVFTR
jgi:UDP-glucose 4-epimerase